MRNSPLQNVLVAGGAGFIGCHLCERLLKNGAKVVCVDNFITGSKNNIAPFFNNPNFTFIEHDVTNPLSTIKDRISNIEWIFHLASPASPNKKSPKSYINHPIETLLVNSAGTYHLLELAREKKARFLFASSSEIYGNPSVSPQKEEYFGNVNSVGVRSVYDEGKRFGEALSMAYFRAYDVDVRIIRIFNTYGERMQRDDGRVISNFIDQALHNNPITVYGDGTQTRSFCYVSDLIDGLITVMEKDEARGNVMNLGNPEEYQILEIARIVKKLIHSNSEIVFDQLPEDDPVMRKPDVERAIKILGFNPKVRLEEGLLKTIEYFTTIM